MRIKPSKRQANHIRELHWIAKRIAFETSHGLYTQFIDIRRWWGERESAIFSVLNVSAGQCDSSKRGIAVADASKIINECVQLCKHPSHLIQQSTARSSSLTSIRFGLDEKCVQGRMVSRKLILNMQHKQTSTERLLEAIAILLRNYSWILKQDKDVHGRHANKYLFVSRVFSSFIFNSYIVRWAVIKLKWRLKCRWVA